MGRHQVVLEDVEVELVLPEDLDAVVVLLAGVALGKFGDVVLGLLVEGERGALALALQRRHEEEFPDFGVRLGHPLYVLRRDFLVAEVVEHRNRRVELVIVLHLNDLKRREHLALVAELLVLEEVVELLEGHVLGLLGNDVLAVVHDLEDGLVHSEALASFIPEQVGRLERLVLEHYLLIITKPLNHSNQ